LDVFTVPNEDYTLLVVDDNESNRDLLSRRLERQQYKVASAVDGRQALDMLSERAYDLVLLDLQMPELSGYEVLEQMQRDSLWRHIPVVVITAVDDLESVARCIALGAEDYLPKPFNAKLLAARIAACLEKKRLRDLEVSHMRQLSQERKRSDDLLHALFPHTIVDELKSTNTVRPRRHEDVAVLFCDIVGFTTFCDQRDPETVITHLREVFEAFEAITAANNLEKIKTIGDAYLATAGMMSRVENPVLNAIRAGLEMIDVARKSEPHWEIRVGIHYGPVVSGLVGKRQYSFDLWGDTVNTASRIETNGSPGAVNVSATAWQQVADLCRGESLGLIPIKGKGELEIVRFKGFLPGAV
jgi:class 3 adenylate cyclase/CheY-like chemotaxis protein